uniref:Uncharacterized protein n=1 Tax=Anguilla anguilla TaxID=7936 RepID=A0A0E9QTG2_ANGAN
MHSSPPFSSLKHHLTPSSALYQCTFKGLSLCRNIYW